MDDMWKEEGRKEGGKSIIIGIKSAYISWVYSVEASEGFLISLYKNQGEKRLIATLRKLGLYDQREGREEMVCWQMAYKNEKIFLRIWVWRFLLHGETQAL